MPRFLRKSIRSDKGSVAPTVGLSIFALIAAGGLAFDYARLASMDTELQNAADEAALAGATQLDGQTRAMERAIAAASSLIQNKTRLANDGNASGIAVMIDPTFTFYTKREDAEADTNGFTDVARYAEAHFLRLGVKPRRAFYALTPIVAAIRSGDIGAEAVAGLGSAICKVPPLMICNPTPGTPFDANAYRGRGIRSVANQGNAWSPGGFGYLSVGGIDTPSTQEAMAFENPTMSCQNIDTGQVDTGNPQPAITAANTRFDMYNYGSGGGQTLSPCVGASGACPAALNVTKDVITSANTSCQVKNNHGNNANNEGWHLPTNRYSPRAKNGAGGLGAYDPTVATDSDGLIDAMGLPRDLCHYTSYGSACPGTDARLGDGNWARADYWNRYHPVGTDPRGARPANWASMTRYETYRWEIENNHIPGSTGHQINTTISVSPNGPDFQRGVPVCNPAVPDPSRDRRVFTVAVVDNCASLAGASRPAEIGSWIQVFFVEPGMTGRGNGDGGNEIYMEVIANANVGATGQVIRRDVPYLVK